MFCSRLPCSDRSMGVAFEDCLLISTMVASSFSLGHSTKFTREGSIGAAEASSGGKEEAWEASSTFSACTLMSKGTVSTTGCSGSTSPMAPAEESEEAESKRTSRRRIEGTDTGGKSNDTAEEDEGTPGCRKS